MPAHSTDDLSGVLHDYMAVTQRLQQTHEALQREVVRLRNEVESKDRELERKRRLASLGELAAGVAHEVRNPLGAMQLYSGLLRSHLDRSGPELTLIEKIDAGIHAIECVVQDTLALAPRAGTPERCSLRSVIAGARDACRPALESFRVRLEERCELAQTEVLAERGALQRVFVNLITNAAQASPRGGTVTLGAGDQDEAQVTVRVLDEGPGVPEGIIEKIFDPFFTTKEDGTGLGLAIAHRLVEAHGGNLTVRNRPGGGAEFVVVLPTAGSGNQEQTVEAEAGCPSAA
jgi:signal transduction histidine kinase